ncbi:MAG: hypothetical protein GVY15_00425 [Bacteroidetes bacterium]|jgi:hypothetical protein|nr:hypothetical protein [Bacteroidota bacterium]
MQWFTCGIVTLFILMAVPSEALEEDASVHLTAEGTTVTVQALFTHHGEEEVMRDYTLKVHREGAAGSSASTQGGSFTSTPGQVDTLATSRVSVTEGDRLVVELTVRAGETTVATASVDGVYPGCLEVQNEQREELSRQAQ